MIKNTDVLKVLGPNLKKARLSNNFTQEFVAEGVGISTDLLRNIENSRNIGSVPTLLNLCNFLNITPNYLFFDLIKEDNQFLDDRLKKYLFDVSPKCRESLKQIIIHIDKNY